MRSIIRRKVLLLSIILLGSFAFLWIAFMVKPYYIAARNGAELISHSWWPNGVLRYPYRVNDGLIFVSDINGESIKFEIIDYSGMRKKYHVDGVVNGYSVCESCVMEGRAHVAVWRSAVDYMNSKVVPQLIYLVVNEDWSKEEVVYDLPREPEVGIFSGGNVILGFSTHDQRAELASIEPVSGKFLPLGIEFSGELLLAGGGWFFWADGGSLYASFKDNNHTYVTEIIDEKLGSPDIAFVNDIFYWITTDGEEYSILSFNVKDRERADLIKLSDSPIELSANNDYICWTEYSGGNTGRDIYLMSTDNTKKVYGINIDGNQHYPVVIDNYIYWEEAVDTLLGHVVAFFYKLDFPIWTRINTASVPQSQSHLFRLKLDQIKSMEMQ